VASTSRTRRTPSTHLGPTGTAGRQWAARAGQRHTSSNRRRLQGDGSQCRSGARRRLGPAARAPTARGPGARAQWAPRLPPPSLKGHGPGPPRPARAGAPQARNPPSAAPRATSGRPPGAAGLTSCPGRAHATAASPSSRAQVSSARLYPARRSSIPGRSAGAPESSGTHPAPGALAFLLRRP